MPVPVVVRGRSLNNTFANIPADPKTESHPSRSSLGVTPPFVGTSESPDAPEFTRMPPDPPGSFLSHSRQEEHPWVVRNPDSPELILVDFW